MASSNKLGRFRKKIDSLDSKILSLLNTRAQAAQQIGRIKAKTGDDIFASDREREIINRLTTLNKGLIPDESIEDIFQTIFATCRSIQKRMNVAYFGPEATFTHQAAIKYFGRNSEFIPLPSIKDVFVEVERGHADYGVVPIENSTEGVVNHTLDMFLESDLVITAEKEEPISQNLLSISGSLKNVKRVYSHTQALAQCRKWLETHLPKAEIHEAASTSDAAVQSTLDSSAAAIASNLAGRIYHLKTIAMGIEDSPVNATRFLIISENATARTGRDKTSILFSMKDRVGALYEMLQPFKLAKLNLTKIESRPSKRKAWEYIFFVDFIGHQSDHVQKALKQLREQCARIKILGSYPYGA